VTESKEANMRKPEQVTILEVGPRDGFQNVQVQIPTQDKIRVVNELVDAGLKRIETSSFVHPKWIPQLKDVEEVFAGVRKPAGVVFSALVPNERGLDRAIATGVKEVCYVVAASETVSKMVFNKGVDEALLLVPALGKTCSAAGVSFRVTIACAFGCAMEGPIAYDRILSIGHKLREADASLITLADSMGISGPSDVAQRVGRFLGDMGDFPVSVHFHDRLGIGMVNAFAAVSAGVRIVESSIAGLGGDPLTPGAVGNLATEELAYLLKMMGYETGVDIEKLQASAVALRARLAELERDNPPEAARTPAR